MLQPPSNHKYGTVKGDRALRIFEIFSADGDNPFDRSVRAVPGLGHSIKSIRVNSGGSKYTRSPTVKLSGGGGSGASATATVANGSVTSIKVNDGGTGYSSAPSVSLSPGQRFHGRGSGYSAGSGTGATATAVLDSGGSGEKDNVWTSDHKMFGISYVLVVLHQPKYSESKDRLWSRFPHIQYQVKGLKFVWPGVTTPTWTDNAAAVRHFIETERGGIPGTVIDRASFDAAYIRCNQPITVTLPSYLNADFTSATKRYSANGIYPANMPLDQVRAELDFSWQGAIAEKNGVLHFRPGADRPITLALSEEDIVSVDAVEPALRYRKGLTP